MNLKMHDSNAFSISKEIVKTSNSTKIITKTQERLHNTTQINFCEPEQEIVFTIVALEHQEARGRGDQR